MYTILIGSVAKNEQKQESDIDIVRIDNENIIERNHDWPLGPINYIDYDFETFMKLYDMGSLFIYHIIHEGKLLEGSVDNWNCIQEKFSFTDNYEEELYNISDVIEYAFNYKIYGKTFLAFYSNAFTLLKNFSIFYLAHRNIFEFNKETAFNLVFGGSYYNVLYKSYNVFERNANPKIIDYDIYSSNLAIEVMDYFKRKVKKLL